MKYRVILSRSVKLGGQPDDLQPFDAKQFAQALFEE